MLRLKPNLPFTRDDSHEFQPVLAEIEQSPGSPLGPLTFWLVIAVLVFFALWSILGEVDVVVSARGQVIPDGQIKLVQSLNGGVVTEILVQEGDLVKQGQQLMIVDPSTIAPALASSQKNLLQIEQEQQRLQASAAGQYFKSADSVQLNLYQASKQALQNQLNAKDKLLANLTSQSREKDVEAEHIREVLTINQEKLARLEAVKDIVARETYERVKNDVLSGESRLAAIQQELLQLQAQREQTLSERAYIQQEARSNALKELAERQKQSNELAAVIEQSSFQNEKQILTAPVDGYVHELFIHTEGGVLKPADKILSIVPVNTPMMVQANVLNQDIGQVKEGMPVSIKLDAFEFQKYGALPGKVLKIDKNSREHEQLGLTYRVYIEPLERSIAIKDEDRKLTSGLSLTAEIKIGKRRIIEFLIYPLIRHLDEGLSVR